MSNKTALSRQPMPPVAPISISVASPGASRTSRPRCLAVSCPDCATTNPTPVVAVSDQIIVAKEKTGT